MKYHQISCFILTLVLICLIITGGSYAAGADLLIQQEGSYMYWFDAHIDNYYIATYVKSSSPNEIQIFDTAGALIKKIPLSNETSVIESLDISDGRVYYAESDMGIFWSDRLQTVFEYDIRTGTKRPIYVTNAFNEHITRIVAGKNHIVMRGGDDMNKIILHTLSSGEIKKLVSSRYITDLAMDGDYFVWGCDRTDDNYGREIHLYSISNGTDSLVPESASVQTTGTCDISGEHVVWGKAAGEMMYINGVPVWGPASGGTIQVTNIATGKTTTLERFDSYPDPFISGDFVFYNKMPAPNEDNDYSEPDLGVIRVYGIKTQKYYDLSSGVGPIKDTDKNLIVWSKFRPLSFWLTAVPYESDFSESPVATLKRTKTQDSRHQNPAPSPESSLPPLLIISALTACFLSWAILKKIR